MNDGLGVVKVANGLLPASADNGTAIARSASVGRRRCFGNTGLTLTLAPPSPCLVVQVELPQMELKRVHICRRCRCNT